MLPSGQKRRQRFLGIGVRGVSNPLSQRIEFVRTRESASCLEIEAQMPSEVKTISPMVDRLIQLIEESRCVGGEELAVELALREALNNAVLHGNRLDPSKLVQVYCRCERGKELSVVVKDQGNGFDANEIPDPSSDENLEREHGRGIFLMRAQMDEISFACGGTEVHMCKRAIGSKAMPNVSAESDELLSSNNPASRASDKS
jgi:serine/threonine-protein kinase RsbW